MINLRNIFFFDIDGTLLDTTKGERMLSKCLANNINALRKYGHIVVACTARPKLFIDLLLPNMFDCNILLNGAFVSTEKEVLIDNPLSPKEIIQLNSFFKHIDARYIYIGNSSCCAYNIPIQYKKLLDSIYMVGDDYTLFSPSENNKAYAIDLFFKNASEAARISPLINATKKMTLNYHPGDFTGDISFANKNKATAICHVLQHYKINIKNSYAFGDSLNDLDVFRLIPNTCAVGNAVLQLKNIASTVSEGCAGLGVLEGLQYWGYSL